MRATAEVRWFLRGVLPEAVARWFEAAAGACDWETRTDEYVRTEADDLGVKTREGGVEVKRRTARLGEVRFAEAAGRVERWRKWRFLLDDAPPALGDDWVAVHKRRLNVSFAMEEEGVRPIESEAAAAQGCNFEVSALRVEGAVWWSVCFEAWGGDEAALPEVLRRVAAHAFARGAPPTLPAGRAMGYPAWLAHEA